jgi:hypothetical protein
MSERTRTCNCVEFGAEQDVDNSEVRGAGGGGGGGGEEEEEGGGGGEGEEEELCVAVRRERIPSVDDEYEDDVD